jgi:hypothetical protein
MTRLLVTLCAATLLSSNLYALTSLGLDTQNIERLSGLKGQVNEREKVFKIIEPRTDLKISMSGVRMPTTMGLTSWASFKKTDDQTKVMANLVLTEDQISPVMNVVLKNGLHITSLENHFLWESPKVMFMHVEGSGKEAVLATAMGKVFQEIKSTSNGSGTFPLTAIDVTETTLNPTKINSILNTKGALKDGVYKVVFSKPVDTDDDETNNNVALTWAAFAGSDNEAMVVGDLAIPQPILEEVLLKLHDSGIYVVSIHQQASNEDSKEAKMMFLHYVGVGTTSHLAKGLHAALSIKVPEIKTEEAKILSAKVICNTIS